MAGVAVDLVEDFFRPLARADIEEGGAGGVAVLGYELSGEPEIQVVVREQDVADAGEVFGFVIFQPEELRDRVAGERDDAEAFEAGLRAAEHFDELGVFGGGFGVVPELGGADDV